MNEEERELDLALAECEAENRLLRARNERLSIEVQLLAEALRAKRAIDDKDWAELWEDFADNVDRIINDEFQGDMCSKHGSGHYYMDGDERWNRQKDFIQKLVNAKLKEKNT